MKDALEGRKVIDEEALDLAFEYKLVRRFGWSKAQIDETPGRWAEMMLAISELDRG